MKEKDLFKRMLNEKFINKEHLRHHVISTNNSEEKGVFFMKKKILVPAICFLIALLASVGVYAAADAIEYAKADSLLQGIGVNAAELPRSEAKRIYRDIKSESFSYEGTVEVLEERAKALGMATLPSDPKQVYEAIANYSPYTYTGRVTSDQVRSIKSGMKYSEIVEILGSTKDIGKGVHVLQYVVDDNKVLLLTFSDKDDICEKSGEELLASLKEANNDGDSDNSFNCTFVNGSNNAIFVNCPTYKHFDSAYVMITKDTEIVFADGSKATIDDIEGELIVTTDGSIRESYPPQVTAVKIVIK